MIEQLPFPFNYYLQIIKGEHLHFGYWPQGEDQMLLEEAQEKLMQLMLNNMPEEPCRILDIGCGLGATAYCLAKKGHTVLGLCPEQGLIDYAQKHHAHANITFLKTGFFEFVRKAKEENQIFDVLLFQESLQYLHPLDKVFELGRTILKEKGRIILCDEFLLDASAREETEVHSRKDLVVASLENGFYIKKQFDIGRNVARTCEQVLSRLEQNKDDLTKKESICGYHQLYSGWENQKLWYQNGTFGYFILHLVKDNVFLRPYRNGDEERILSLFNKVFASNRSMEHWAWKFRNNPYGNLKIALAVDDNDNVAAHYAAYPVQFYSNMQGFHYFLSYQAGDTMTNPAYRQLGLGRTSVLTRTAEYFYAKFCEDSIPYMYGFNTGSIRKFGERYLDYIYSNQVRCLVLNRYSRTRSRCFFWQQSFFGGLKVREIKTPLEEFNAFFERVKDNYGLLVVRDFKYLKWRYFDVPDTNYYIFGMFHRDKMIGWAVFKRQDTMLIIGDCLWDVKYKHAFALQLEYIFYSFPGINMLVTWCSPGPEWWEKTLINAGFYHKEEPNKLALGFKIFDNFFSTDIFQKNFYYTMGDSDLF